jgi:hypothetical protein
VSTSTVMRRNASLKTTVRAAVEPGEPGVQTRGGHGDVRTRLAGLAPRARAAPSPCLFSHRTQS